MEYLIVGVIAFVLGLKLGIALHKAAISLIVKEEGVEGLAERYKEESQEEELEVIPIKIEERQGQLYAYRVDNEVFLGQGRDRESLIERLSENLDHVRLTVTEENGAHYLKETSTKS